MAPAEEQISATQQEALKQLEKGSAGPAVQFKHAEEILEVDLALCAGRFEFNYELEIDHSPQAEWVLRWLLKRLKTKPYWTHPTSFLLLQQLIHRISSNHLAIILIDHKFLTIVNDALKAVEEDVLESLQGTDGIERSDSDTSHTLDGSPVQQKNVNSKKRKRAETVESGTTSTEQQPSLNPSVIALIHILEFIFSLINLVNKGKMDKNARSHLKQALRTEPAFIAEMLGRLMKLSARLMVHFLRTRRIIDFHRLIHTTAAFFDLWILKSAKAGSITSNAAFSEHCFLQAMRLLLTIRTYSNNSGEAAFVVRLLEGLITHHIVFPARNDFFARGGSGIDYSEDEPDWGAVKPVSDTLRPLLKDNSDQLPLINRLDEQVTEAPDDHKLTWKPAELLPLFLDIAIRSVPRATFRAQTAEAPWLETLFVALAELAFSAVKAASPTHDTSNFIPILEQMFDVVLNRKVQLSLPTLLTHGAYTGLLKESVDKVQWRLTALLIDLGVDIFLPNSGLKDSTRFFTALLEKIQLYWISSHHGSNESYAQIKDDIVIPLLRAFAAARDLPRFIEIWHEQLVGVESARIEDKSLSNLSIWEDDDLVGLYGEMTKTSLMAPHVNLQAINAINAVKTATCSISPTPASYAHFVILEAGSVSWRHVGLPGAPNNLLRELVEAMKRTLSSTSDLHWRWRLWRLAGNIAEPTLKFTDGKPTKLGSRLVTEAVKNTLRHHQDKKVHPRAFQECLEAARFVLRVTQVFDDTSCIDKLNNLAEGIVTYLKDLAADKDTSLTGSWNGRVHDLDSATALATAYMVSFLRTPEIWAKVNEDNRQDIFDQLLSLAVIPRANVSTPSPTTLCSPTGFSQLWTALVSHEYLLNVPAISRDLLTVFAERLEKEKEIRTFIVASLQRFPARLISRQRRATFLNLLEDILIEPKRPLGFSADIMSLMTKMVQQSKTSANMTRSWDHLWKISKAITLEGSELDLRVLQSFRCLIRAVVAKFLALPNTEVPKVFKIMYTRLVSLVSKMRSLDDRSLESLLARVFLSQLWENRAELSSVLAEKDLMAQRKKVFELVLANANSVKKLMDKEMPSEKDVIALTKALDAFEEFEDLARCREEAAKCLREIEGICKETATGSGQYLQKLLKRRVLSSTKSGETAILSDSNLSKTYPLQHLFAESQRQFVREITDRFHPMSFDQLVDTIHDIRVMGLKDTSGEYRLLLAGLAVAALEPVEPKRHHLEAELASHLMAARELTELCTAITEWLPKTTSIEQFSVGAECLDILFRTHPGAMTQKNIDDVFRSINGFFALDGPPIDRKHAGTIFVRLCRLTGLLFGLYRQRLGGRYQVMVPTLQLLMTCLFCSSRKRKRDQSEAGSGGPQWLSPLDASHAVHLTRLLTSLCDPTLSAVSKPTQFSPDHGLTDQSKKAKRIAGQQLRSFIMTYTQHSLAMPISAEIKAALAPGLYAVLDVMSSESKRSLSEGLGPSGRAIFKALYDDYVKYGRWNNKG